jgi:small-conductance mechanosensitive channel
MKNFLCLILLAGICFALPSASAQRVLPQIEGVDDRRTAIERISRALNENAEADLLQMREELRTIRINAISASRPLRDVLTEIEEDLARLGPEPAEGETEAADIAEIRGQLKTEFNKVSDALLQADLNIASASRLLQDISKTRRDAFYRALFSRGPSPVLPSSLKPAAASFGDGVVKLRSDFDKWRTGMAEQGNFYWRIGFVGLALLAALMLFGPVRRWVDTALIARFKDTNPSKRLQMGIAASHMLARLLVGIIGGWIVLETAKAQGFIIEETEPVAHAVWFGIVGLLLVDSLVTAIFAPKREQWRLIPINSASARTIRLLLNGAAWLFVIDLLLRSGADYLGSTLELATVQSAIMTLIGAAILLVICRHRHWIATEEQLADLNTAHVENWTHLRQLGTFVGFMAIIGTLAGYVALAQFVISRIFLIAFVLALIWFLRALLQQTLQYLEQRFNGDEEGEHQDDKNNLVFFWFGIVADVILFVVGTPILLITLGVDWIEVRDWLKDAFFGFKVGNITISIASLLSAVLSFIAILIVTRLIQRGVDKRFFGKSTSDVGVRNSLRTLLGYVGLVFGLVTAIAIIGVNLANLAIIAGALSLGIGFGLQSIVNNFVSGLILLFERPIKVGDWIVVTSGEGIVKRISVRSTEIETFDRSSIIVPNSELISSSVTNWTHKDKFSRIIVPVGVSYDEDPEEIVTILQEVMNANNRVVRYPEPLVYFKGFGDSSLDFEMRVFIRDPADRIPTQNELRIAAFSALKKAGAEIPFPQRDLHVKTLPDGWRKDGGNTGKPAKKEDTE